MLDELILKDQDRRGRPLRETAELLKSGAVAAGMRENSIILSFEERDAVQLALTRARPRGPRPPVCG